MSRLETISKEYYDCSLAQNAARYTVNKEYLPSTPDTISDGDMKGRDPKDGSASSSVGTVLDIEKRNALLASNRYNQNKEYNSGNA